MRGISKFPTTSDAGPKVLAQVAPPLSYFSCLLLIIFTVYCGLMLVQFIVIFCYRLVLLLFIVTVNSS